MSTVTVYEFEVWDAGRRRWTRYPRLGTLQAVIALKGIPALHTSLVIDETRVDADGFVTRSSAISY